MKKLLDISSDWIYDNIFHFSADEYDEMRDLVLQDAKRKFRMSQIENEGNDPLETGETYGTPHDIATSYGVYRWFESNHCYQIFPISKFFDIVNYC